jgi:hypothetical protein
LNATGFLRYRSGEEIKKGDRVLFHHNPAEIDLSGAMVLDPMVSGRSFIQADSLEEYADLEFVSRVAEVRSGERLMWKRDATPKEAAQIIERFLDGESDSIEWCDWAESRQQGLRVERYRKRSDKLSGLVNRPGEMDEAAVDELRSIIEELRSLD